MKIFEISTARQASREFRCCIPGSDYCILFWFWPNIAIDCSLLHFQLPFRIPSTKWHLLFWPPVQNPKTPTRFSSSGRETDVFFLSLCFLTHKKVYQKEKDLCESKRGHEGSSELLLFIHYIVSGSLPLPWGSSSWSQLFSKRNPQRHLRVHQRVYCWSHCQFWFVLVDKFFSKTSFAEE